MSGRHDDAFWAVASETTKEYYFVGMPPGTILLTPMSVKIQRQRKRPWQRNDVSRKGLPCAAAFACTDYKVQGRTFERVALELRGARATNVDGRVVPAQCDPYGLYVQLSRCRTLDASMLVSKVRERDLVGNRVPEEMSGAQSRLEELCGRTIRGVLRWLGDCAEIQRGDGRKAWREKVMIVARSAAIWRRPTALCLIGKIY
ncbi:PIF1 protein [Hirsutella rhossiliensis]|uniref:PIF1 protein n=1 Tax=Hirsutella rhossiliensis TaxID=111463 RepID=A0A9P8MYS8_9HYPO|nr:PIF1 protein [Hirsutella rhossiliensis]KAH0962771.1 PIF1 protein [Hirsutella rhossiliensis]